MDRQMTTRLNVMILGIVVSLVFAVGLTNAESPAVASTTGAMGKGGPVSIAPVGPG
jgi:hypothetical protein